VGEHVRVSGQRRGQAAQYRMIGGHRVDRRRDHRLRQRRLGRRHLIDEALPAAARADPLLAVGTLVTGRTPAAAGHR
jgi:hypothetical protein